MLKKEATVDQLEWAIKNLLAEGKDLSLGSVHAVLAPQNIFVSESNFFKHIYKNHLYRWKENQSLEDAQQRRLTQEKINELERTLSLVKATLESTADGILVLTTEGKLVTWNQKFIEMFRFPLNVLETRDEPSVLQYMVDQLTDPQGFFNSLAELYADPNYKGELNDIYFKDGRVFERYSQPNIIGNQIVGRVFSFRDVTIRREKEQELRLKQRAIEASTHGVIITANNNDQNILFVNSSFERITGFSLDNVMNKNGFIWLNSSEKIALEKIYNSLQEKKETTVIASVINKTGTLFWAEINIAPVPNNEGEITHFIWVLNDITQQKILQELKEQSVAENALTQKTLQVAHDIKSPVAAILMLAKSCANLPEEERVAFREAGYRIQQIANNLMAQHGGKNSSDDKIIKPCLISALIFSIISEKIIQYKNLPIKIVASVDQNVGMAAILVNPIEFKRTISNLINNSVEAINGSGLIKIHIELKDNLVIIAIEDNGKGIPSKIIKKINAGINCSYGKETGMGLGIHHAKVTVQNFEGSFSIKSNLGKGTNITISFPLAEAAAWVAKEIVIIPNDKVIVLDDDKSIHQAWETKFSQFVIKNGVQIKHFRKAEDYLNYIKLLSDNDNPLLLIDYELVGEKFNGIDIIKQCKRFRSILVTSHYDNEEIIEVCQASEIMLLPKMLASEILVRVEGIALESNAEPKPICVKAIVVDDSKSYTDVLKILANEKVLTFNEVNSLLDILPQIPKATTFYLDYDLGKGMNGGDLAAILFKNGFEDLYLTSGFGENLNIPHIKGHIDKEKLLKFI